jgi:hypothetical protein
MKTSDLVVLIRYEMIWSDSGVGHSGMVKSRRVLADAAIYSAIVRTRIVSRY